MLSLAASPVLPLLARLRLKKLQPTQTPPLLLNAPPPIVQLLLKSLLRLKAVPLLLKVVQLLLTQLQLRLKKLLLLSNSQRKLYAIA